MTSSLQIWHAIKQNNSFYSLSNRNRIVQSYLSTYRVETIFKIVFKKNNSDRVWIDDIHYQPITTIL